MTDAANLPAGALDCHRDIITLENVSFSYREQKVIRGLDFAVKERDFVGLIGSNGAGKTTLLRMIVGLLKPEEGTIRLFGEPVRKFKGWHRIGYVPQKNAFNPLFPATVREVVMSGLFGRRKLFRRLSKDDYQNARMRCWRSASRIWRTSGSASSRAVSSSALFWRGR
ncbi:hypothetical protein PACILC2_04880 [Paenibacillus cisolokensis]|uniref:ABC transporter domain-containing protein n=1 Tax=Paenibacillus cisolokensis TaxID=1658519 RepID=A0ABQ4N176_9BACL|nr:hypothetical protein PACILC2_04880 [Paenibacillus cisolokensis]